MISAKGGDAETMLVFSLRSTQFENRIRALMARNCNGTWIDQARDVCCELRNPDSGTSLFLSSINPKDGCMRLDSRVISTFDAPVVDTKRVETTCHLRQSTSSFLLS